MIQEILTYIIVAGAFIYAVVQMWQMLFPKKKNQVSCTGSCGSCSLKVKHESFKLNPKGVSIV